MSKVTKCIICGNISQNIGKLKGLDKNYFIYCCDFCNIQFIDSKLINEKDLKKEYDKLYSGDFVAYDRYKNYADKIKNQSKPLEFLKNQELAYAGVFNVIKKFKTPKRILEIGCGEGYLSFALKNEGHSVTGIDISREAIFSAKKKFGNFFHNKDIKDLSNFEKYDVIIATEVIEHLINPKEFLQDCKKHLSKKGIIILTTPNKDYKSKNKLWWTDLPPIHISWLGKKSFERLGVLSKLGVAFPKFRHSDKNNNYLVSYLSERFNLSNRPDLNKDGVARKRPFFIRCTFVREISNFIHDLLIKEKHLLTVIFFEKK